MGRRLKTVHIATVGDTNVPDAFRVDRDLEITFAVGRCIEKGCIALVAQRTQGNQRLVRRATPDLASRQAINVGLGDNSIQSGEEIGMSPLQVRERKTAVAEDVERAGKLTAPGDKAVEQCYERCRLLEWLTTADRHAVATRGCDVAAPGEHNLKFNLMRRV
jgi:hypothetical protein